MTRSTDNIACAGSPPPLSRPNRKLTELARDVARCARPLLPLSSGLILGLQQDSEGRLRMIWWRGADLRLIAEIEACPEGFCPEDSDEGMMQEAGAALLSYLAGRWPATPRRLGIITDGTGVAFSPDHPATGEPGWLLHHATGGGQLAAILPLDPQGPCTLLCNPVRTNSYH